MKLDELRMMDRLRAVMKLSSRGKGMAASFVETFGQSGKPGEVDAVRSILLGVPVDEAVASMAEAGGPSRDLLLYLVGQAKVDSTEASRRADRLSTLFEHWVRAKQERLVDQRIMETRSLMVSGILGGVTAMVAALAPVLSGFQLTLSPQQTVTSPFGDYLGLLLVIPGAFFLGLFFSPRRALLNVAVSCAAYALVVYLFAPLVLSV